MSEPLFSVAILAHNNAAYIEAAIGSVLAQTRPDWELLVSDDASTDDTAARVEPFLADPRIRYVRHERNLRQAANWAYALEHATAPLVLVLHADDAWKPKTLACFARAFDDGDGVDLVWANWLRVNTTFQPLAHQPPDGEDRLFSGPEILRTIFRTNCVLPSAAGVRRTVLARSGMPKTEYGMLCDREWWLRVAAASRQARSLADRLTLYRIHEDSVTGTFTRNGKLADEMDDLRRHLPALLQSLPEAACELRAYDRSVAEFFFRIAVGERIEGQPQAARHMRHALASRPGLLLHPRFLLRWLPFHLGAPGRRLLSRIHGHNHWVSSTA